MDAFLQDLLKLTGIWLRGSFAFVGVSRKVTAPGTRPFYA